MTSRRNCGGRAIDVIIMTFGGLWMRIMGIAVGVCLAILGLEVYIGFRMVLES
jgi:hypothetical protein